MSWNFYPEDRFSSYDDYVKYLKESLLWKRQKGCIVHKINYGENCYYKEAG